MSRTFKLAIVLIILTIMAIGGLYYKFNYSNKINTSKKISKNIKKDDNLKLYNSFNNGDLDKVIKTLNAKKNKQINDLIILGWSYLQDGSLNFKEKEAAKKGIDIANQILKLDPKNVEAYHMIGYANEITMNYDEAIKNYQKALEIQKNNADIVAQMGHAYDLKGDFKKAKELYQKAYSIDNNNLFANLSLGRVAYRENRYQDAIPKLKMVIEKEPNNRRVAEAAGMLAQTYIYSEKNHNLKEAEKYTDLAIQKDPKFANAYLSKAQVINLKMWESEDDNLDYDKLFQDIEKEINKAIELNPTLTDAYWFKAKIFIPISNEREKAVEAYQKALEVVDKDNILMDNQKKEYKKKIKEDRKSVV